ncbi:MAG TPA: hypothetical protein VFM34_07660 [Moraxellaceae bacterium]|nr:hypothetical protein [Moraxellaceae bacterium]
MQDYGIVFSGGLCDGVSMEEARDNLARLLRIQDPERLNRLFSGTPIVLKKGLDETQASRYEQALRQAGVRCDRRRFAAATPATTTASASATASPAASSSQRTIAASPSATAQPSSPGTATAPLALHATGTEASSSAARHFADTVTPAKAGQPPSNPGTPVTRTLSLEPLALVPTEEAPSPAAAAPDDAPVRPFATPSATGMRTATSSTGTSSFATPAMATGAAGTVTTSTRPAAIGVTGEAAPMRNVVVKGSGAGYGDSSIIPDEIRGLCWGGFFMPWIWGGFNGVRITFLALPGMGILRRLLPRPILIGVSLLLSIFMLFKGRELAWQNRPWDSAEHFNRVQRRWTMAGLGFAVILALLIPSCVAREKKQEAAMAAEMARLESERANSGDEPALQAREATLNSMQDPMDATPPGDDANATNP